MSWDEFGMVMIANDYAFKTDLNLILISAESSQMIHSHTVSYSMWTQTLLRLKHRVTSKVQIQKVFYSPDTLISLKFTSLKLAEYGFHRKLFRENFLFAHSKL